MKINAEKWIFGECDYSFKVTKFEKCCDRILNTDFIALNSDYNEYGEDDYSVKLVDTEYDSEGFNTEYYEKIRYCPFCGEEIEINIIGKTDMNKEYMRLRHNRDLLWDKCRNTDSKKDEAIYKDAVRDLDKAINNMYESDKFKDIR